MKTWRWTVWGLVLISVGNLSLGIGDLAFFAQSGRAFSAVAGAVGVLAGFGGFVGARWFWTVWNALELARAKQAEYSRLWGRTP